MLPEAVGPRADLSGHYAVAEEPGDGRLVLAPDRAGPISLTDTRLSAMHERGGTREATPEEFEEFCREHGPFLPRDGEG